MGGVRLDLNMSRDHDEARRHQERQQHSLQRCGSKKGFQKLCAMFEGKYTVLPLKL